ncbi:MFS transporter, NNP family, nitrate/nitrite transporter [Williamwhitmania taraxaci]|uniref:MFS transporter, NNP family, nitrate/nitrite transporter n=2 Tax=Williamwhitmania taraxaci TaxID=1640674 RepID=A0A1G6KWH8_9BACT|nr:MFS transporter, NNP family, nitrate/nitrite transporter [Williamwhitmania taraxaci]
MVKGSPSQGLLGTTLGFFFGFAAVSLYGPTAIKFKEAMELTPAMMGFLVAIPALSGSLLRIPFGAWVDTTGGKKPFLILMILSVIGLGGVTMLLNLAYPNNMHGLYGLILFFGFLSGAGIATFSVGIAQTSYWFPKHKQGMALGTYAGLGNLAPGIFSVILPFYLQSFGFISAYFAWFLFLVLGTITYAFIGKNAYYFQYLKLGKTQAESLELSFARGQENFPAGNVKDSLINSAKVKNTWALVALYFTTFGGFIALTAWFPVYWNQLHGFSVLKAGLFTAVFSIIASLVRVYGGKFADKVGGEKVSLISLVLVLLASITLSFDQSVVVGFSTTLLLAIGMGINNAAVFKLVPEYVPKAIGGASGWIGGLGAFGGFAIPPIMGAIASANGKEGYAMGFLVFVVLAIISIAIVLVLKRQHRRIVA